MSYYTGDIAGEFVWCYQHDDGMFRHVQNPFFLEHHGGTLQESYEWEGCGCYIHDNNLPYCMQCYDSAQEHKNHVNSNDLKAKRPVYDMRIHRDDFHADMITWLQEHESIAREGVRELSFCKLDETIHYNTWECLYDSPNFNIVQEYCFLKQIEYFFEHSQSDLCWFHIHE
uniref:Uncharacterized protein n=1 Tax=viral metagenome TaxID=1070528 RepID=A0A6C0HMG7_9ZZZZ